MKRYQTLILSLFCVAGLSLSIVYDIFYTGKPDFHNDIAQKIEQATTDAHNIAQQWIDGRDKQFIDHCWQNGVDDSWRKNGVSIYLYQSDSLLFWGNHIYQFDVDSIFSSSTNGIEKFGKYEVLVRNFTNGNKRATVITNLRLKDDINTEIFDNKNIELVFNVAKVSSHKTSQIETVNLPYCSFKFVTTILTQPVWWVNSIGWLGFFAGLFVLKRVIRGKANTSNSVQQLFTFFLIMLFIRVVVYFVDIPYGGSYSLSSLGSVLITQLFILMVVQQGYQLRYKIRHQIEGMTQKNRYALLLCFSIFIDVAVAYFHYAMVQTIYINSNSVELYNVLAIEPYTLFFYFIGAVFVTIRVLYGRFFAITLYRFPFGIRFAISVAVMMTIVAPIEGYIGGTGYILLLFHMVFLVVAHLSRKQNEGRVFIYNLVIFSTYITLFSAIETSTATSIMAEKYAAEISTKKHLQEAQHDEIHDMLSRLTYSILTHEEVILKAGNKFDAQRLLPFLNAHRDTIVQVGNMVHNIKKSRINNSVIAVSYEKTKLLDIIALFAYLFIWLFVVSGVLLTISHMNIFKHYNPRSMLYRIRSIILGVVILSMAIVVWVVYRYSGSSYNEQQRQLLNTSVQSLMHSFNQYSDSVSINRTILNWYDSRGSILRYAVNIYDINGKRIGGSEEHYSASRLYDEAYRRLVLMGLPYFDRSQQSNDVQITIAYIPMSKNNRRLGFMSVVLLDKDNTLSRYGLLGNIFNVFVILFLIAIMLSLGMYAIISKPLSVISNAFGGIGQMQKIPIKNNLHLNDEVGLLITQYNNMIDYLNDSYAALARAEREGAWREMARQVAHEIKNPLTPMKLKIQMLQRSRNRSETLVIQQLDSTLEVLLQQIDILSKIATEFSDLARMPQGAEVRIELSDLIRNTVGLYSSNDCVKINFEQEIHCGIFVKVEYAGLMRVIVNLLQNAMQAIEGYGSIEVRLRTENDNAVVEIEDSGMGIAPDMMERIFEPNFTTKSSGSGLGLAISRQIIESSRGTISARNGGGGGAIFTITLPLV